jgi:hypothetical protein
LPKNQGGATLLVSRKLDGQAHIMWKRPCVFVLTMIAGCATVHHREGFEKALAARAPVDLQCPASELRITQRGSAVVDGTDLPVYQHVEGCGLRVEYLARQGGYEPIAWSGLGDSTDKNLGICGSQP